MPDIQNGALVPGHPVGIDRTAPRISSDSALVPEVSGQASIHSHLVDSNTTAQPSIQPGTQLSPQTVISAPTPQVVSETPHFLTSALKDSNLASPGLHDFTSRLKEKGDREGVEPSYLFVRREANGVSVFVCQASYNHLRTDGMGKSKKEAKHNASKAAWNLIQSEMRQRQD